jgi:hypothetical protein
MTRFYFHLRKGESFCADPEGAEFADLEAARKEAMQSARELVAESIRHDEGIEGQFEIAGEDGNVLLRFRLSDAVRIKS